MWRWLTFYLPLWGAIGYMIFVYSRVWNELKAPSVTNTSTNDVTANAAASGGAAPAAAATTKSTGTGSDAAAPAEPAAAEMVSHPSDENVHESNSNVIGNNTNAGGGSSLNTLHPQHSTSDVGGGSSGNAVGSQNAGAGGGRGSGALQRIKYYPVVLFVCYFFATVRRLDELITGTDAPFGLAAIQVFMSALLGTCNALVYGLSPVIRKRDMDFIKQCLGKEPEPTKLSTLCFCF